MDEVTLSGGGAGGRGRSAARWAFGAIWLVSLAWGVATGVFADVDLLDVLPYLTLLLGGYLLLQPGNQPLSPPRAVGVVLAALASDVFVLAALTVVQESWLVSLACYLIAFLIARGNSVIGGVGAAVALGYGLAWTALAGATAEAAFRLLAVPFIAIVVALVWRVALRRLLARERLRRENAERAAREARAATEAAETGRAELAAIQAQAGPLLERIAAGEPLEGLRPDLRVVEGAVRDRIRSPGLQQPILTEAIADRRRAGVDVLVLCESQDDALPGPDCVARIAQLIAEADAGRVTLRILPPGRDAAASVVHAGDEGVRRVMIGADGTVLARI
ncbi:hypothetical protein [Micropruina sp.]|uniref:hypothetical protein n=1 Tax=Micropruina sp. TaxID=2737536 RepID=UPI00260708CD|nr:hypothetical protein [Micropruina sp.]